MTSDDSFDAFWSLWPRGPRKVAKPQCRTKYEKAAAKVGADKIMNGLRWWLKEWAKDNNKFVPLVATWLNQERWEAAEEAEELDKEFKPKTAVDETRAYLASQALSQDEKQIAMARARELRARMRG